MVVCYHDHHTKSQYKIKSLKIKSISLPPLSMETLYGVLVGPTQYALHPILGEVGHVGRVVSNREVLLKRGNSC
jgi:hypothetical protein